MQRFGWVSGVDEVAELIMSAYISIEGRHFRRPDNRALPANLTKLFVIFGYLESERE